jgi:hypothetical protein
MGNSFQSSLARLAPEQAAYLSVQVDGLYKPWHLLVLIDKSLLTKVENNRLRSQNVTLRRGQHIRYLPNAF